jgi:hypothetical protein
VLLDQETEVLNLRRDAQIEENKFSRSNKENLNAEAEAIAAVNNQLTKRKNIERTIETEKKRVNGQIRTENARAAKEQEAKDKEAKRIRDAELKEMQTFQEQQDQIIADAEQRKIEAKIVAEEQERVRLASVAQADRDARDQLHVLEVERLRENGEETYQMEIDQLIRKRDYELSVFEGTLLQKEALIKKFDGAIGSMQKEEVKAAETKEAAVLDAAMNGLGEAFGLSQEVAVARMVMAAPEAIGSSFKMAAEAYAPPVSIAMGALGAAGVVAPIIKGLAQIKKTRFSGSKKSSSGGSISMPAGVSTSAITDLTANNAANLGGDTDLSNSASAAAAANVNGSSSNSINFVEGQYNDFIGGIDFIEGQTNIG